MLFTDAPLETFGETLLDIAVPSKLGFKTPLVFRCLKLLKDNGYLPKTGTHMAELCFEEIFANSIIHGNDLDENKEVHVRLFGDGEKWGLIVTDEGSGFSEHDIPDPDSPEALLAERGRGIMLIKHFVDELSYNSKGNAVRLVRTKQTQPEPQVVAAATAAVEEDTSHYEPQIGYNESLSAVSLSEDIELDELEEQELPTSSEGMVVAADNSGIRVVKVQVDRMTEDNAAQVQELLYPAVDAEHHVVLDLEDLQFMSSKGISLLLAANKRVIQSKRKCVFAATSPAVFEILKATGLVKLLKFADSVEAALSDLSG